MRAAGYNTVIGTMKSKTATLVDAVLGSNAMLSERCGREPIMSALDRLCGGEDLPLPNRRHGWRATAAAAGLLLSRLAAGGLSLWRPREMVLCGL